MMSKKFKPTALVLPSGFLRHSPCPSHDTRRTRDIAPVLTTAPACRVVVFSITRTSTEHRRAAVGLVQPELNFDFDQKHTCWRGALILHVVPRAPRSVLKALARSVATLHGDRETGARRPLPRLRLLARRARRGDRCRGADSPNACHVSALILYRLLLDLQECQGRGAPLRTTLSPPSATPPGRQAKLAKS